MKMSLNGGSSCADGLWPVASLAGECVADGAENLLGGTMSREADVAARKLVLALSM